MGGAGGQHGIAALGGRDDGRPRARAFDANVALRSFRCAVPDMDARDVAAVRDDGRDALSRRRGVPALDQSGNAVVRAAESACGTCVGTWSAAHRSGAGDGAANGARAVTPARGGGGRNQNRHTFSGTRRAMPRELRFQGDPHAVVCRGGSRLNVQRRSPSSALTLNAGSTLTLQAKSAGPCASDREADDAKEPRQSGARARCVRRHSAPITTRSTFPSSVVPPMVTNICRSFTEMSIAIRRSRRDARPVSSSRSIA